MLIGYLALAVASLFTGAAFYVNFAEQPARLQLDDRSLLAEWKPSYQRGFAMQASLAMLGFLLGAVAWWQTGLAAFLLGALYILAPWPWTLLVIKPVNDALMATDFGGGRTRNPRPAPQMEPAACRAHPARRGRGHLLSLCRLRGLSPGRGLTGHVLRGH